MRKVENKKTIRNLADKSFRANRQRNIIAVLAIALTAMLFCTLFTIGLGTLNSFQQTTMRQSGGDSHGTIKNITREQYETLKTHPLIRESADCMPVADEVENDEFLKRHVEAWYIPTDNYAHWFLEIMEGCAPQKADEILLDEESMKLLGVSPQAGEKVTLAMRIKQQDENIVNRTFTVSGVLQSSGSMNTGFAIVSKNYLDTYAAELKDTFEEDGSTVGRIQMDIIFSNSFHIQKKLEQVITESGYSVDEASENYIACNANWAYVSDGAEADPVMTGAIIGALLLILLTGYLIIYNVFQISVIREIQYYGLLKTIGTTGRQIKQILRRQALKLSVVGIPIGCIAGFFLGKYLVPVILENSGTVVEKAVVTMNPLIFIGAALFSLLTVCISVRKPAKIAARVSPVEAMKYTGQGVKKREKKTTDGGKIYRMAFSNLGRSKGRTMVVILSLSLSVVLLNSVFTITNSFDMNTYLSKFATWDFLVGNARYFGQDLYMGDADYIEEDSLSDTLIEACESEEGFERGGRIYATNMEELIRDSYQPTENVKTTEEGEYYVNTFGGNPIPFNQREDGNYWTDVYGLEDFPMEAIEIVEGERDFTTIKEKLATGEYLLACVPVDDNGNPEKEKRVHDVGDRITLQLENGDTKEFTILSLIEENYYGLTNRHPDEFSYYTTADVFRKLSSEKYLMSYCFDVEDGKEEAFRDFLEGYTTTIETQMDYESRLDWVDDFQNLVSLFVLVGGILSMVIGLIGVLNFINSILTSIVTRQKEFAVMEAIGMTKRQLRRMLIVEGIFYALFTIVTSLVLGSVISVTVVRVLAGGMWFMKYEFVIWPMLVVYPVLLLLGVVLPWAGYHLEQGKN